ncbi:MAG: GWxTD domain-containing protein, partial [bacterium]
MKHGAFIIFCMTLFVGVFAAGAAPAAETLGSGDIEFFLDGAVFRTPDTRALQEIYIRIPNSELRFKASKGRWESLIKLEFTIKNSAGKKVVDTSEDMRFHEALETDALDGLQFHTIIKQFRLEPGEYNLSCVVTDEYALKSSLVGMIKGSHNASEVDYYPLEIPRFGGQTMSVSGAKFLWAVEDKGQEQVFHPNPSRLYGLHRDSLCVYIEAYVPAKLADAETINFDMEILDPEGEVVRDASLPLPKLRSAPGDSLVTYPIVIQEDLNTLPAGSYSLYVNAGLSDQLLVRMRCGAFSVAWDLRTWEISRRDYISEARFLIGDQKIFDDFEDLSLGEQEKVLDELWKELDPDPTTGFNEAYQKFLTRLAYVRERYSDYQTGIISDRGMIYLRYGPPDDLEV